MKKNYQNKVHYLRQFIFFSLLGFLSCKTTHQSASTVPDFENTVNAPRIIFLNYSIESDKSNGEFEIVLIDKLITEGKLKSKNPEPEISKPGDLKCIVLNGSNKPIDSLIISDPLNITVESVDYNNTLFKKEIARDSAQFSIRLQLSDQTAAVGIKRNATYGKPGSFLLITKIK